MIEGLTEIFEDVPDWEPTDANNDGSITGDDLAAAGLEPGSLQAKKAWMQIENEAHNPANVSKCKALGYEDGRGMYNGRPLVPGAGPGQADFQLLKDRLIWHQGHTPEVAVKIAAKARWMSA